MNVDAFLQDRQASWSELDQLLRASKGRPARLGAAGVVRLGALYRAAVADLATARRSFPGEAVTVRLEDLVLRGRAAVYASGGRGESVRAFFATTYWRAVRERPVALVLAALLLFVPMAAGTAWGLADPSAAARMAPGAAAGIGNPRDDADLGLSPADSSRFSAEIMTNNIRVTFTAFAGGVLLGLGTAAALVFNGLLLGAVTGIALDAGNLDVYLQLIVPHGVLELSCIVVAGAAGLRLGRAILLPGTGRRGPAITAEARRSVQLVAGTAPWLVLAGLVEGFVTPAGIGPVTATVVGTALAAAFWALVAWRGRSGDGAGLEPQVGAHAG
jgi:uncharacterized membrane protein SpoIIM required for sporulation